jgi:transposase-like protein
MPQLAIEQNSTHTTAISTVKLSPQQFQVASALAQGHAVSAAAREAGVHRGTIYHWLRTEPEFKAAATEAKREYVAKLNDYLRELSAHALDTLRSLLDDPATPHVVRLKAAIAVLERPQYPEQGWSLPERVESPEERKLMEGLADMKAYDRVLRAEAKLGVTS